MHGVRLLDDAEHVLIVVLQIEMSLHDVLPALAGSGFIAALL